MTSKIAEKKRKKERKNLAPKRHPERTPLLGKGTKFRSSQLTYFIKTYGCQMNYSDTERLETVLDNLGMQQTKDEKQADVYFFNTCSVKQKAEDRVHGEMKKLIGRRNEGLGRSFFIGITGCMVRKTSTKRSEEKDSLFKLMKQLDFAVRIEEIGQMPRLFTELNPNLEFPEIAEGELGDYFSINPKLKSQKQVFVPIGTGCDKFCTYCIVPYTRGRERSRSIDEIFNETKKLVEDGAIEVTLVGQTVNSYGLALRDKQSGLFAYDDYPGRHPFTELLYRLDELKAIGLKRLRFTSPYAPDMSEEMIDAMAKLETLQPYIHLPIQSGDDRVLKRMNRKYTVNFFRRVIKKIRKKIPGIAISTDIIVGFCGETDEEFQKTYDFYKEIKFDQCYLSQYSPRIGTTSQKFFKDDVDRKVKRERWHKLNNLMGEISYEKNKALKGKAVEVLVEQQRGKICIGRSEHFKTVHFLAGRKMIGELVKVKIVEPKEWILEGVLV